MNCFLYSLAQYSAGLSKLEIHKYIAPSLSPHSSKDFNLLCKYCQLEGFSNNQIPTLYYSYYYIPLDEWLVVSALLYQVYCFFDRVVTSKRTPLLALLYFYRATPAPLPTFHSLDICYFCNGLIINWIPT